MPNERVPTKREMDCKLGFNTDAPTQGQIAKLLGCSARHVGALVAAGHLTKGADLRRVISEWTEYKLGIAAAGRARHG